jgi:GTPase
LKREKELDTGNVEYKLTLTNLSSNKQKLDSLATQMHWRLGEGGGEAMYLLGVDDDGRLLGLSDAELEESEDTLKEIAALINAKISKIRIRDGEEGKVGEYLIRRIVGAEDLPIDITIDTVGNVDSGKSSIIGCLISNELDNGRGSARLKVLRHLHEIESGRTSSVSHQVLGFDAKGRTVNYSPSASVSPLTMSEIVGNSSKIISFVDLAGHERYLKTTIFGLAGYAPDYSLLVIGANAGVLRMTKEHLGVSAALKIPIIVVINKIDLVDPEITNRTQDQVKSVLKLPGVDKIPMIIKNHDDIVVVSKHMPTGRVAPIFKLSCITGEGLDLLRSFLNLVPARLKWDEYLDDEFLLYIDEVFSVTGVGTVASGTINRGTIHVNDIVKLGPFSKGGNPFKDTRIRSIQYKRVPVKHLHAGQSGTFALHGISYDDVRKGMILTQMEDPPTARTFSANVFVLYHPTTIRMGYEAVIHVNTIRQTAKIIEMSEEPLRTGQRANVKFRFKYKPEYIMEGQKILFREGRTKGIGIITSIENLTMLVSGE